MDKEQIMIDGVDILKEKINMCFILLLKNKLETPETFKQTIYEHLDAFVKEWNDELVHKTHECEELEKQLETSEKWRIKAKSLNEKLELRNTCYRKALEEIEKIVSKNYYDDTWADISIKLDDILNIINNAKGEGKCQ